MTKALHCDNISCRYKACGDHAGRSVSQNILTVENRYSFAIFLKLCANRMILSCISMKRRWHALSSHAVLSQIVSQKFKMRFCWAFVRRHKKPITGERLYRSHRSKCRPWSFMSAVTTDIDPAWGSIADSQWSIYDQKAVSYVFDCNLQWRLSIDNCFDAGVLPFQFFSKWLKC